MKASRLLFTLTTAGSLSIGGALVTARTTSVAAPVARPDRSSERVVRTLARAHHAPAAARAASHLSPLTLQELTQARRATAKYHDIANAEADGYVNGNLYTPGEGYHYIYPLLIDGTFNPERRRRLYPRRR